MACPLCGDVCHCSSQSHSAPAPSRLRPRFELDGGPDCQAPDSSASVLVDPEAYDASEERFSASLNESPDLPQRPRFILDEGPEAASVESSQLERVADEPASPPADSAAVEPNNTSPELIGAPEEQSHTSRSSESDFVVRADPSFWKDQVAERLNSYRAKRKPRAPRYPSLRLKFEPPERGSVQNSGDSFVTLDQSIALEPTALPRYEKNALADSAPIVNSAPAPAIPPETGRIIEFPRFYSPAVPAPDELAERIMDVPRIVEAPEITPPAPALGGIILEPEEEKSEKRPGFEIPLQPAPMSRRVLASTLDGFIVLIACALFGYTFFQFTAFIPPLSQMLGLALGVAGVFWAGYQYLLLVYTGSTPGLRLAKLHLSHFDGTPVRQRMRRWRVLASILSAVSLGLGFAWCYLDEDALCWHDRITRTYLAPK